MFSCFLAAVVTPRTGEIIKNCLSVFEEGKFATKWYIKLSI